MTAVARPRGDESVADFGAQIAAGAVAATHLTELLDTLAERTDAGRIVVLLEVLGRLTVTVPEAVSAAIARTMEGGL